ncbi:glycerophosphodiester phosphodiesterase family protein [Paenarthrobacter sp. S56]|uniref:glycerophosphodiester phosphodiesterase n=1 Tax=Paenarthrobacter sp. S56 TaxID=3138179 RepID=UPI003218F3EB
MIEIQGHRGALATRAGNTLGGFVEALRLGVDAVEVDLWLTADGQLALRHDAVVDGRDIRESALHDAVAEKQPLTRPASNMETRPPTLEEVLALLRFADAGGVVLDIEVKTDGDPWTQYGSQIVAALSKTLEAHAPGQALRVRSFDPQILRTMAGSFPDIPMVAKCRPDGTPLLGQYPSEPFALIEAALATGAAAVAPGIGLVNQALVARAHTAGLKVYPWTLTTAEEMSRAVLMGVDGICVDDVGFARDVLASMGQELPASRPIVLPMLEAPVRW